MLGGDNVGDVHVKLQLLPTQHLEVDQSPKPRLELDDLFLIFSGFWSNLQPGCEACEMS